MNSNLIDDAEEASFSLNDMLASFDENISAYAHMPTKNPYLHFCFALNIEMSAEELIEALKGYLADLEQGICKEVLCIEKKMVRKEYWEKGGQLLHNLQAMMGRLGQEKMINAILKVQNGANYETFIACVDNCYEEVARLLGEIRQNVMKMPRHLYGQFYKHMKSEFDADSVLMAYDEWEMNVGRLSYERLKEKRTLIVAEFLMMNVLRFVSHPTNRELELVDIEGIKTFLPSNYAMADDFKEQCAKFCRFISWQDDRLVLDYDAYGKYLFQHYYMLKEEERVALLALDKWLQLIQQDMEKVKPEVQEAATSESVETETDDDDLTTAMQQRIKNCIYEMTAEGTLKHLYDYTWVMMVMNETDGMPRFDTPTSFVDYMKQSGVKSIPTRSNITKYYDKARGKFPNWTFPDADGKEATRRNNVAKRFINLMRCGNNSH